MTPPKSRDYKAPTYLVFLNTTIFPHSAARLKSANLPPRVSARPRAETRQATGGVDAKVPGRNTPHAQSPLSPLGVEGFDGGRRACDHSDSLSRVNGRPQRPYTWGGRAK